MKWKRIIIICEGQTEQKFCNKVLQPHFSQISITIDNATIKKTGGGIVNWETLKYQIETYLKNDPTAIITTLIDFYGIHANHKYPKWEEARRHPDKNAGMDLLEKGMLTDITEKMQTRFLPYIQLHEFEALLFSDIDVFDKIFETSEFRDYNYLKQTIDQNENPEMINDGVDTAPSKRLSRIIIGYNKVRNGYNLADKIGLTTIRAKCPRFNDWITKLEKI